MSLVLEDGCDLEVMRTFPLNNRGFGGAASSLVNRVGVDRPAPSLSPAVNVTNAIEIGSAQLRRVSTEFEKRLVNLFFPCVPNLLLGNYDSNSQGSHPSQDDQISECGLVSGMDCGQVTVREASGSVEFGILEKALVQDKTFTRRGSNTEARSKTICQQSTTS